MYPKPTKQILQEMKKEGDEYTMKYFVRPLSNPISLLLIKYTGVTPNQVSVFAFSLGLIGVFFFWNGGYANQVIGAFFSLLYILFDCIDGNIARVKQLKSLEGRWLDAMGGFIITPLILFALIVGMKDYSLLKIGSLAMLAYPMQYLIVFFYKFRIAGNNEPLPIASSGRLDKLRYAYGSALFFPLLILAVVFQKVDLLLWFYAVVGNIFWVLILVLQYREIKKRSKA